LGLALTVLDRDARRARLWIPWAAALGVTLAGYAAHWVAATAAFRATTVPKNAPDKFESWWHPDGSGLLGSVDYLGRTMGWPPAPGWVATALGLAGAIVGPRERLQRLLSVILIGGGIIVVSLFRPAGITTTGAPVGYWSEIYTPTLVACIPLALAWLPGARNAQD
jgi:hypothetical protein